jgi:hypothetical protein
VLIVLQLVRVNSALLNVLIGKAEMFASTPNIGEPVARDLRSVEGVFDVSIHNRETLLLRVRLPLIQALAFSLIDNVQGRADDLEGEARRLGEMLKTAVAKYSGLA